MTWQQERGGAARLKVLTLSRNYPNSALPRLGLWAQRLTRCVASFAEVKVVSPAPYMPTLPSVGPLRDYARYRTVARHRWDGPVEVLHPRLLVGPGYRFHQIEAAPYALAAVPAVRRLRRRFPFDLIHAHFGYPDGVVACLLGKQFDVPVVMTEHAPWLPWMRQYPLTAKQAIWAAHACAAHVAVSRSLADTIVAVTGDAAKVHVIPNVVDGDVFRPRPDLARVPGRVLFVGAIRYCKGVDVLLEALALLRPRCPRVHLVLAGEAFYRAYQKEADRLRALAHTLGVGDAVTWAGGKSAEEAAVLMAQSEVVVLPSRAESFGAVLIEALACGTPVVATRCGGPEEVVTPDVGALVPSEDPAALAAALGGVLERRQPYAPAALRRHALGRYGVEAVSAQLARLYGQVLGGRAVAPVVELAAGRS